MESAGEEPLVGALSAPEEPEKWRQDAKAFAIESLVSAASQSFKDVDPEELRAFLDSLPARYVLDVSSETAAVHHFRLVRAAVANPLGPPLVDIVAVEMDDSEASLSMSLGSSNSSLATRGRTTLSSSVFSNPGLGSGSAAAFGFSPSQGMLGDARAQGKRVYEFTFVAGRDRPGLLATFSEVVSNKAGQDIIEAHSFCTLGGAALTVMVTIGDEITTAGHQRIQAALKRYGRDTAVDGGLGAGAGGKGIGCPDCVAAGGEACTCGPRRGSSRRQRLGGLRDLGEWLVDPDKLLLQGLLEKGPACSVHRATYYGSEVACKVLRGSAAITDVDVDPIPEELEKPLLAFAGEAALLRRLRHKNMVKLVGIGRTGTGELCLLLEYLAGGRLDLLVPQVHKTWKVHVHAALLIAREAARGMVYLHSSRIVHRDLRAGNLMVSETGTVALGGFGTARLVPGGDEVMTGETGTYRWMAPEVIKHERYSDKADVYSFGIMMWELLSSRPPYEELPPVQAALRVVQEDHRPVFPSATPPAVAALAARCWHPDPAERPGFDGILAELDALLQASPLLAEGVAWEHEWGRIVQYGVQLVESQLAMARHQLAVASEAAEGRAGGSSSGASSKQRPKSRGGIAEMFKRRISSAGPFKDKGTS